MLNVLCMKNVKCIDLAMIFFKISHIKTIIHINTYTYLDEWFQSISPYCDLSDTLWTN